MDEEFHSLQSELMDLESDLQSDPESPWQQFLPDNLIFEIFWFLNVKDLISASQTCKSWWRVAQDDFLWKDLLCKKCGISKKVLPKDNNTWKDEYKRIFYDSCFVASETLTQHVDEVYHVSFSRSGRMFSTVGKDGTAKIWRIGNPTTLYGSLNLKLKSDSDYTRFSEFNESETMIMVACLVGNGFWSREGLILVATVKPDPEVLHVVQTDFCNFRGAWVDDRSFLSANIIHSEDYRDTFCLKQYEKFEGKGNTILELNHNASGSHDFIRVLDCEKLRHLASDLSSENLSHCEHEYTDEDDEGDEGNKDSNNCTDSTECLCSANTENPLLSQKYDKLILMAQDCYDLDVRTGGDIVFYGLPLDTQDGEENSQSDTEYDDEIDSDLINEEKKNTNCKAIHKICCQGGLIGIALSPDHRYLAYNYRRVQNVEGQSSYFFSNNMEIKIFDIVLGRDTGMCYKGHKAEFTHTSLSYIFPSVSTDYVASGSETANAHVWDRYYGYSLGLLGHTIGPQDIGVNAVAFSPADQEVLISTGDDKNVKIWRTKRRMKELLDANQGLAEEMNTCSKFVEGQCSSAEKESIECKDNSAVKKNVKKETDHNIGCWFCNKRRK